MGNKLRSYVDIMALHNAVTGSCNMGVVKLPTNEKFKFLVDCGMFQEREYDMYNRDFTFEPDRMNYVFVTHNHIDHVGRLPLLVNRGYNKDIYCTPATKTLMHYALEDSYKVLRDISRVTKTKQLYTEKDVFETVAKLKEEEFEKTINLKDSHMKVTFFKNGHLLGAALILVQIQYKDEPAINILYTGDYNDRNMFFTVPELPQWVRDLSVTVVQESTYGCIDSDTIQPCFKHNISCKMKNGGTAVILVYSLGRCQEVLKTLREMQDEGTLDKSIPIYCDGKLAFKYTNIYLKDGLGLNDDCLDFLPKGLVYVDDSTRDAIIAKQEDKIILTTSGSGSYGPAPIYLQKYVGNPNAMIHFTGYLFEDSLGRRLRDTPNGDFVKINGIMLRKEAEVLSTSEFSAHAKADQMISFLNQFKNLQAVLINHGEPEVKDSFAKRVKNETRAKDVAVLDRSYFFRIGPWGIEKSVPTKFE